MQNAKSVPENRSVNVTHFVGEIDNEGLKDEPETCEHFLVDSEMEDVIHTAFNFAVEILDAHTLRQKPDTVFEHLKCAANLDVAYGFVLKDIRIGTCGYNYPHENNSLMERSKLVTTKEDLVKVKNVFIVTLMWSKRTQKNERIQKGNSVNSQLSLFLLLSLEKIPCGVKTQYFQSHLQNNTQC